MDLLPTAFPTLSPLVVEDVNPRKTDHAEVLQDRAEAALSAKLTAVREACKDVVPIGTRKSGEGDDDAMVTAKQVKGTSAPVFSDSDDDTDCAPGFALGGPMTLLQGRGDARQAAPEAKRRRSGQPPLLDAVAAAPPAVAQREPATSLPRGAPKVVAPARPKRPAAPRRKAAAAPKATVGPRQLKDCIFFVHQTFVPCADRKRITKMLLLLGCKELNKLAASATHIAFCIDAAADDGARKRLLLELQRLRSAAPSALIVKHSWLLDSLDAGCLLPLDSDLLTPDSLAGKPAPAALELASGKRLSRGPSRAAYACQPHLRAELLASDKGIRDWTDEIIRIFRGCADAYAIRGKKGDTGEEGYFKGRVFNYASRRIRQLKFPLNNEDDAERARVVLGWTKQSSCFVMLLEILNSAAVWNPETQRYEKQCARLEALNADPIAVGTRELRGVFGIGPEVARQLWEQGIDSVAALRARLNANGTVQPAPGKPTLRLNAAVLVGLRYYEDMQHRIPRAEVEAIFNIVREHAEQVAPGVSVQAVGSFRRGALDSGDVDILVTHPDDEVGHDLKNRLLRSLTDVGLISAELAGGFLTKGDDLDPQEKNGCGAWSESFMGFVKLPEPLAPPDLPRPLRHRRMDIKVYAKPLEAYALLYFTGSERFNRSMRHWAKQRYLSLSDRGLVPCIDTRAGSDHALYSASYPAATEEDVFRVLELEYVAPADRNNVERA